MGAEDDSDPGPAVLPGEGDVRAKTIRIGPVILAVENVDSIALTHKPRTLWPTIYVFVLLGAVIAVGLFYAHLDYGVIGAAFCVVGGLGVALALLWPSQRVLAVGTTGGRTFYVAGKREFLAALGDLLRRKIDTADPDLLAQFSASGNLVDVAPVLSLRATPLSPPEG
jgi:hypothetical protein